MADDTLNTFAYAGKFGYLEIADEAASELIDVSSALIRQSLGETHPLYLAWVRSWHDRSFEEALTILS